MEGKNAVTGPRTVARRGTIPDAVGVKDWNQGSTSPGAPRQSISKNW